MLLEIGDRLALRILGAISIVEYTLEDEAFPAFDELYELIADEFVTDENDDDDDGSELPEDELFSIGDFLESDAS